MIIENAIASHFILCRASSLVERFPEEEGVPSSILGLGTGLKKYGAGGPIPSRGTRSYSNKIFEITPGGFPSRIAQVVRGEGDVGITRGRVQGCPPPPHAHL